MHQEQTRANVEFIPFALGAERPGATAMATERLPFTIRRVEDEESLWKAVRVRQAAYARHVPEFARSLVEPEQADHDDDTIVLLAESRLDGTPLGSCRIRTNAFRPLAVEESVMLPSWLQERRLIEVGRLAVDNGRIGRVVKTALLKACVMYCQQHGIEWALAAGRAPIDRQYEQLTFIDVFEEGTYVPLSYANNIPHRVMAFNITDIEERWSAAKHPLLNFFCHTHHPDINLGIKDQARPTRAPVALRTVEQSPVEVPQLEVA